MQSPSSSPRTELALRTDAALVELERIQTAWTLGRAPSVAELEGIADDLEQIRSVAAFVSAVAGWELPAYERV